MCTSYNYMNNLCSLYWEICILTSILVQVFNLAFSKSALLTYIQLDCILIIRYNLPTRSFRQHSK